MSTQNTGEFEGVILAAGRGTRMAPFSERFPKPLLPVLNKPMIQHQVEYLRDLGVRKVFIVIGHLGYEIARHLGRGDDLGVEIVFVEQRQSHGIAHAVMQLEPVIRRPFAMLLGDIYFELDRSVDPFAEMQKCEANGFLAVMHEPKRHLIRRNFAVHMEDDGRITRVVEKPRFPRTDMKGCGLYVFDVSFFDAVRRTPRSAGRDEFEITDAIQIFIDDGAKVIGRDMVQDDINLTFPYDVLLANLHALRKTGADNLISPEATIAPGAKFTSCVIGARARIGSLVSLTQTVVMPETSVNTREPVERAVITPERFVDCRHWVDSEGRGIDHSDE